MKIPPSCAANVLDLIKSDNFLKDLGDNGKAAQEVIKACLAIDDLRTIIHIIIVLTSLCTLKEFAILHDSITSKEGLTLAASNTKEYIRYNSKN